jgi:hypothetical protein
MYIHRELFITWRAGIVRHYGDYTYTEKSLHDSQQGQGIYLPSKLYTAAQGTIQSPEGDLSPPASAKTKKAQSFSCICL